MKILKAIFTKGCEIVKDFLDVEPLEMPKASDDKEERLEEVTVDPKVLRKAEIKSLLIQVGTVVAREIYIRKVNRNTRRMIEDKYEKIKSLKIEDFMTQKLPILKGVLTSQPKE